VVPPRASALFGALPAPVFEQEDSVTTDATSHKVTAELTLDLDSWVFARYNQDDGRPESVGDALFAAAAHILLDRLLGGYGEDSLKGKVAAEVSKQVREALAERIDSIIDGVMADEITRYDEYGRRVGEPTPVGALVKTMTQQHLQQKVDDRGQVSSYDRDHKMPRIQWVLRQAVSAEVDKALKTMAQESAATARQVISDLVAAKLGKA